MSPSRPRARRSGAADRDARLYRPRRIAVELGDRLGVDGVRERSSGAQRGPPIRVAGSAVESIREEWLVEDRWWTSRPLRRRYYELALSDGRCLVVFHDLVGGGWYEQRA